ncbi:MAG TPA: hypothetical protein VGR69_00795 [Candidatus Rubrimentiphilum sp.]|nr:hypothetical protein [Candidatus Rubrimentiphilum sp.]
MNDGHPRIGAVIMSSIDDALALSKKNIQPAGIAIVLAALLGVLFVTTRSVTSVTFVLGEDICIIAAVVVEFYAIAAAVRTMNPDYRMGVGQFFGILGYSLLVGLLTMVAALFLIIPAFWVGVKLQLTPYTYAVTNGESDALGKTWNMTTGYYWETIGFFIVVAIVAGIVAILGELLSLAAYYGAPVATIVAFPVAAALFVWAIHFEMLAYIRWTASLLQRVAPVESPAVTA